MPSLIVFHNILNYKLIHSHHKQCIINTDKTIKFLYWSKSFKRQVAQRSHILGGPWSMRGPLDRPCLSHSCNTRASLYVMVLLRKQFGFAADLCTMAEWSIRFFAALKSHLFVFTLSPIVNTQH